MVEPLLLDCHVALDALTLSQKFGERSLHEIDHRVRDLAHERALDADHPTQRLRTPKEAAQDIALLLVAGQKVLGHEKRTCAYMVGDGLHACRHPGIPTIFLV